MENKQAFRVERKEAAAGIAIVLSILLWAYFLGATGLTARDLFTFKLRFLLEKIISRNFLFFLLAFPLTGAIIAPLARKMEKARLMVLGTVSSIAGIAVAMALFPSLQGFWLPAAFYVIGVPLGIETAYSKYAELKSLVSIRTLAAYAGKSAAVLAIGLFLLSTVTILPQQEAYVERFEETFMENVFQGLTSGGGQQQLASGTAALLVENQKETLGIFMENPLFTKLEEKEDADVIAFVASIKEARAKMESEAYRNSLEERLGKETAVAGKGIDVVGLLKKQLPFLTTLERFLWAVHGFVLASLLLLTANVAFKPLAIVYGLVAEKGTELASKRVGKATENN